MRMEPSSESIFRRYFFDEPFVDQFLVNPEHRIDVVIPVMHTNELWRANLMSIYREVPVNRLLIGDAGCSDDTLRIVRTFPRVLVFDHRHFVSLGYSIRKLIEAVETEWFAYLHSDVYLPAGWFERMNQHRSEYDWFECRQHITVLVDYPLDYAGAERPYSGSQMGRRRAFQDVLPLIDDDYLYRNEDIVLAALVEQAGFRYGRVDTTFHYHQVMHKASPWLRRITHVGVTQEKSREEETRECTMQVKGIIKYMKPTTFLSRGVRANIQRLFDLGALDWPGLKRWAASTNAAWLPYLHKGIPRRGRLRAFLRAVRRRLCQ